MPDFTRIADGAHAGWNGAERITGANGPERRVRPGISAETGSASSQNRRRGRLRALDYSRLDRSVRVTPVGGWRSRPGMGPCGAFPWGGSCKFDFSWR